jgi:hypothetical protein
VEKEVPTNYSFERRPTEAAKPKLLHHDLLTLIIKDPARGIRGGY